MVGILNSYDYALMMEKEQITLGLKVGDDASNVALTICTSYELKLANAAFRYHLASCMPQIGYKTYWPGFNLCM